MGAAHAVDVLCVGAVVRVQALHPVEVGLHAFPMIALHARRNLQVDIGVGLGRHAAILAAGEDEPVAAHFE